LFFLVTKDKKEIIDTLKSGQLEVLEEKKKVRKAS
jgi:hypothetical protein